MGASTNHDPATVVAIRWILLVPLGTLPAFLTTIAASSCGTGAVLRSPASVIRPTARPAVSSALLRSSAFGWTHRRVEPAALSPAGQPPAEVPLCLAAARWSPVGRARGSVFARLTLISDFAWAERLGCLSFRRALDGGRDPTHSRR